MPKTFITYDQRVRQNVNKRQALKRKWDKKCKYSAEDMLNSSEEVFTGKFASVELKASTENYIRLLDEGVVVDGDGFAYAVISKGSIKEWFDSLPEDFEGYIDYDHIQSMKLGYFHKSDLRLVELEDERYGVDVNVKLDNDLYLVKDILHNNSAHAVSSEFSAKLQKFVTASEVTGGKGDDYPVPVLGKLNLVGYVIVDNPKNANSFDDKILEKASNSERTEVMDEIKVNAEAEELEVTAPVEEAPAEEAPATEEETVETEASAGVEPTTPTEEAEEAPAEEPAEETAEEPAEETAEESEEADDASEKVEASIEKIGEKIEALQAELKAKDAKIAELEAKLSAKEAKKQNFAAKLENLLNFAEAEAPTVAEGKATTTEKKEGEDEYSAALENAFKEM